MSITREKLNEIASVIYTQHLGQPFSVQEFAHALLKAVEAEMEVVGYRHETAKGCYANEAWVYAIRALIKGGMMTDYQHLIDELTWFAEQDKDFIEPKDSINTKAAESIKALITERDAAFAMSKCECESNEACKNLVALHDEVERLKSALREARDKIYECVYSKPLVDDLSQIVLLDTTNTIRTALGE